MVDVLIDDLLGRPAPPPSTASRSDKEAKQGPNQKGKFLEKHKPFW